VHPSEAVSCPYHATKRTQTATADLLADLSANYDAKVSTAGCSVLGAWLYHETAWMRGMGFEVAV
jgi:hypothetical protein